VAAASAVPAEAPPLVRVLIRQQASLALAAAAAPLQLADAEGSPVGLIAAEQPFALRQQQGALVVVMAGAAGVGETLLPLQGDLWIVPLPAPGRSALVMVEGQLYRGRLQVRAGGDGRLLVINQLPLERYLPSVVGSEMPAAWPQAALRAQAVAARTYAISQLKPKALFDLKATVDSQVYRGVASETDSTRSAVASTRSQVLMQGNVPINAVFHSSSGGNTENSGEVWSRQLPYLVSVPDFDQRSPMRQWQQRIEPDQLRRVFRETAGVSRIDVLAVSRTGRIRRARVIGPAGSLELSGAELRQRLGLRSTLVKAFRLEPVAGTTSITPAAGAGAIAEALLALQSAAGVGRAPGAKPVAVAAKAGPMAAPAALPLTAPAALPLTELLQDSASGATIGLLPSSPAASMSAAAGGAPVASGSAAARPVAPDRSAAPAADSPQPALELVVDGRGFGHGVGMSQWGAYAMALQGRSYEQILRHYYRGVDLKPYVNP
jgi:stage II sporulation protein D